MEDGTTDRLRVRFPAAPEFARIGRVTIAGLALRLDVDVQRVENLRLAVDHAVAALGGEGDIEVEANWAPGAFDIRIENDDAHLPGADQFALVEDLGTLVDHAEVTSTQVLLQLRSE